MPTTTAPAATVSKRRAFFTLLGEVYDELPKDAVNKTVVAHPEVNATRAGLVQRGSTADIELLAKMVRTCLPKYKFNRLYSEYIPGELK